MGTDLHHQKILIGYSIVSPLHLVNFLAAIVDTKSDCDVCYVFTSVYWQTSILPARYLQYCQSIGLQIIESEAEKKAILKQAIAQKAELEIVTVRSPSLKLMLKGLVGANISRFTIIDEGISSFAGFRHTLKASYKEQGLRYAAKAWLLHQMNRGLRLFYHHRIDFFSAFDTANQHINPVYQQQFVHTLNQLCQFNAPTVSNPPAQRLMVFCSQPWVDMQRLTAADYAAQLHQLQTLLSKQNISLAIKKHPADKLFDYQGFELIEFDGIVEEWVAQHRPEGVISTNSTSSLLIPACLGGKSYLLNFDDIQTMDPRLIALFTTYCQPISDLTR